MPVFEDTPIRAICADLDGFILDTMPALIEGCQQAGIEVADVELEAEWLAFQGGVSDQDFRLRLMQAHGADFPFARFKERMREVVIGRFSSEGIPLKPGAAELIEHAEDTETPLIIATGTAHKFAWQKLAWAGLDTKIGHLVGGDEVVTGKPDPALLRLARTRLIDAGVMSESVETGSMLMGGDHLNDVAASRSAGMQSLYVPEPQRLSLQAILMCDFHTPNLLDALTLLHSKIGA